MIKFKIGDIIIERSGCDNIFALWRIIKENPPKGELIFDINFYKGLPIGFVEYMDTAYWKDKELCPDEIKAKLL